MLSDKKITTWTNPVADEADRPSRSASAMKQIFDSNSNELKDALNEVIDELLGATAAGQIGSETIDGLEGNTVRAQILALMALKLSSGSIKGIRINGEGNMECTEDGTTWRAVSSSGYITETTTSNLSGLLKADGTNVEEAQENVDYAAAEHATRHAAGGEDPIKVGETKNLPVFVDENKELTTKSVADSKIALDIDPRGFEYGGREIPFTWAEIRTKVQAGDFTGLRVGDYKDIILNGTFYDAAAASNKTISSATFRMEIAGICSYYQYGDTAVGYHIDFISRDCYNVALSYNSTATNSGSFVGSALFTTLNGTSGIVSLLPSNVAAVVIVKRGYTETKTGADASGAAWNDMGKLWLPTEREVWGNPAWSELKYDSGLNVQYPIFKDGMRHIVKGSGYGGAPNIWRLASSMAGSADRFCSVNTNGYPTTTPATTAVRVPICFRVG